MPLKYLEYEKAEAVKPEWLWPGFIRLGKVCLITGEGGVGNTRGRGYYDAYLLLSLNKETLSRTELLHAVKVKAEERGSTPAIENHAKILADIAASSEIAAIWDSYQKRYPYAKGIALSDILVLVELIFTE